jgi:hypothetical protein
MPYSSSMQIEFDAGKDATNLKKHGVSLAFGAHVLADAIDLTSWTFGLATPKTDSFATDLSKIGSGFACSPCAAGRAVSSA